MRRYAALILDLCDTIMPYCSDRMPKAAIRGEMIHTTTPLLYDCFREYGFDMGYEPFHDCFMAATESTAALRLSGEEIASSIRFARFLDLLKIAPSGQRAILHSRLMQTHLNQVAHCLYCPNENKTLLTALKQEYPIGLVTNFDDTETVYTVLDREGVRGLFDTILISAEFGLRKPRKEIFLAACENLGIHPTQALFIGDSIASDIAGASGVGMDTAWINPHGVMLSKGAPQPNYILTQLSGLTFVF
jgi:putative hydrolase of the HAD superfamily